MILAAALIVLVGVVVYGAGRISRSDMALLYGSLESSDSSQIIGELLSLGVVYEQRENGGEIYVSESRVLDVRMAIAAKGLPNGLSGNDILDRDGGFGETRLMQGANLRRALEGELARTIRSISEITSARVHLSLPERQLFTRDQNEAGASVLITLKSRSTRLSRSQVQAIQHLVASAVTGLDPTRISLVDNNGTEYISGNGEEALGQVTSNDDYRIAFQNRLKEKIESLLAKSVGAGNVRAEVTADINFDQRTVNSVKVDPDSRVEISVQAVEENTDRTELDVTENVSSETNLPDQQNAGLETRSKDTIARTEETINYEISKTTETMVRTGGQVNRLSVAVIVDGIYEVNADGVRAYQPRSPEFIEEIAALTRAAIGFNAERGDLVDVRNQQFFEFEDESSIDEPFIALAKGDYFKIAEIIALLVVSALVVLLVLRPLATKALGGSRDGDAEQRAALTSPDQDQAQITADETPMKEVDINQEVNEIEGCLRSVELRKIDALVDKYPEHAVNIIRGWLYKGT